MKRQGEVGFREDDCPIGPVTILNKVLPYVFILCRYPKEYAILHQIVNCFTESGDRYTEQDQKALRGRGDNQGMLYKALSAQFQVDFPGTLLDRVHLWT